MVPENRIVIASIIVGIFGAIVGGLVGYFGGEIAHTYLIIILPAIVTGFLACFCLSILYLKWTNVPYAYGVVITLNLNNTNPTLLRRQKLRSNIIGGWKYSILAAVISATLTSFFVVFVTISFGDHYFFLFFFGAAVAGLKIGIPAGVVAWIFLSLVYIVFLRNRVLGS